MRDKAWAEANLPWSSHGPMDRDHAGGTENLSKLGKHQKGDGLHKSALAP